MTAKAISSVRAIACLDGVQMQDPESLKMSRKQVIYYTYLQLLQVLKPAMLQVDLLQPNMLEGNGQRPKGMVRMIHGGQ